MLAMLRKDCFVMGRYSVRLIIVWTLMAWIYAQVPGVERSWMYSIMPVMAANIVVSAVNSDQACRWDLFAAMTPLRPWQMVLEKYLLFYGLMTLLAVLSALACWAGTLNMWTVVVAALLFNAMGLPLVYRFGRHTGSTILLGAWGVVAAVILGAAYWRRELLDKVFGWMGEIPASVLAAGTAAVVAVINIGSILLSVRFYARRQQGMYD